MSNDMKLKYTRAELLERLEALRPAAVKEDEKALSRHQRDEQAYLKAFRTACREALKWDYETAKEKWFEPEVKGQRARRGAPSCPISKVDELDVVVAMVTRSTQQTFTLSEYGPWHRAFTLLTADIKQPAGIC